ncbi:MAG: hypothetical protein KJ749_09665 [Planctomycetes bacterium]|nr:hypothetical protein [Planctomycetota bacterium]
MRGFAVIFLVACSLVVLIVIVAEADSLAEMFPKWGGWLILGVIAAFVMPILISAVLVCSWEEVKKTAVLLPLEFVWQAFREGYVAWFIVWSAGLAFCDFGGVFETAPWYSNVGFSLFSFAMGAGSIRNGFKRLPEEEASDEPRFAVGPRNKASIFIFFGFCAVGAGLIVLVELVWELSPSP